MSMSVNEFRANRMLFVSVVQVMWRLTLGPFFFTVLNLFEMNARLSSYSWVPEYSGKAIVIGFLFKRS